MPVFNQCSCLQYLHVKFCVIIRITPIEAILIPLFNGRQKYYMYFHAFESDAINLSQWLVLCLSQTNFNGPNTVGQYCATVQTIEVFL